jgi:hypothetical protein
VKLQDEQRYDDGEDAVAESVESPLDFSLRRIVPDSSGETYTFRSVAASFPKKNAMAQADGGLAVVTDREWIKHTVEAMGWLWRGTPGVRHGSDRRRASWAASDAT